MSGMLRWTADTVEKKSWRGDASLYQVLRRIEKQLEVLGRGGKVKDREAYDKLIAERTEIRLTLRLL